MFCYDILDLCLKYFISTFAVVSFSIAKILFFNFGYQKLIRSHFSKSDQFFVLDIVDGPSVLNKGIQNHSLP